MRALVLPNIVNRNNVGMVEGGCGPGLLLEAAQALRVRCKLFREHFDSHVPPEPEVFRPINFAHTTRPDSGDDLVMGELLTGCQRHWIQPGASETLTILGGPVARGQTPNCLRRGMRR